MRSGIFRSTPFRLTLILGIAFVAALAVAGFIAFELVGNALSMRTDEAINDTFKIIGQAFGDSDEADLIDSVNSHVRASVNNDRIYGLTNGETILAGNVAIVPPGNGWMTLDATSLGISGEAGALYRVLAGDVQGHHLLVGQSSAESSDIARIVLTSLGWGALAILVMVVGSGGVIAIRAQRRLDRVGATMTRVGHGELSVRIPVSRRGDDIDTLAGQVNAALDRLGSLVEGMRQVSVNIAHDLKTPLNRLAITLDSSSRAAASGLPVTELLTQAATEIQQINSTFDALLRIAQIEAGARRARFVRVDIGKVLDRIGDAFIDVAEERGQRLTISRDADLAAVEGDSDLLTQLCANLVENSMRHGPAGTRISLLARQEKDRLVLRFVDDGPGIPKTEQTKVFERLYRVEKSRTTPGSGLGLSLVKAVADLHGAKIELGNNAPGLVVTVSFPLLESRPREDGAGSLRKT